MAKAGRDRKRPLRADWDKPSPDFPGLVKDEIMYEALYASFTQYEEDYVLLLGTGDEELVEASPIDYYWGAGKDGSGKNMLGKLLVMLRTQLRQEAEAEEQDSEANKALWAWRAFGKQVFDYLGEISNPEAQDVKLWDALRVLMPEMEA